VVLVTIFRVLTLLAGEVSVLAIQTTLWGASDVVVVNRADLTFDET
jgi:hypothetical protein